MYSSRNGIGHIHPPFQQISCITDEDNFQITEVASKAKALYRFIDPNNELFLNPKQIFIGINTYLKNTGQSAINTNDVGQVARIVFEGLSLKYRFVLEKNTFGS